MKTYVQVLNDTLHQILEKDERVYLIGQGCTSPWYVGGTTKGLLDRFGEQRIIDTPVSENGVTGVAIGSALVGMHPILMFPRMDFMYYAFDQIANSMANWHTMFGGKLNVPITIWAIINRGGEQAAQHSQNIQAMLAHLPDIKVVAPSNGYDAKGLLYSCIKEQSPTVFIDDRWLYNDECEVPDKLYELPLGEATLPKNGRDVTVATMSYMVKLVMQAVESIDAEVIDLRSLKPLDKQLLISSVKKTGKLLVVDTGWISGGINAEVIASVVEQVSCKVARLGLPDMPAPANRELEKGYYTSQDDIKSAVRRLLDA